MLKSEWLDNDTEFDEEVSYAQVLKVEADLHILRSKRTALLSLYDEFTAFLDTNPSDAASDIAYDHREAIEDLAASMQVAIEEAEYRFNCAPEADFGNIHQADYRKDNMAITKKGLVIKPDTMEEIILQVLSTGQELTTNKIMQAVREVHLRKISRHQLNVHLSTLFKKGVIVRVQKGNGSYIPAIYKAKGKENE